MTSSRTTKGPNSFPDNSGRSGRRVADVARRAVPGGERKALVPRAKTHEKRLERLEATHAPRVPDVIVVSTLPGPDGKDHVIDEDKDKLAAAGPDTLVIELRSRGADEPSDEPSTPQKRAAHLAARARPPRPTLDDEDNLAADAERAAAETKDRLRREAERAASVLALLEGLEAPEMRALMSERLATGSIDAETYQRFEADVEAYIALRAGDLRSSAVQSLIARFAEKE